MSKLVILQAHPARTVAVNPALVVYVEKAPSGATIHFSADASWPDGKPSHVTLHILESFEDVIEKLEGAQSDIPAAISGEAFLQEVAAFRASLRRS